MGNIGQYRKVLGRTIVLCALILTIVLAQPERLAAAPEKCATVPSCEQACVAAYMRCIKSGESATVCQEAFDACLNGPA